MKKRYELCFYGSVQGVGFRYTARHAASLCGVTGWVRNEYDGSVTCEVQGDEEGIDKFIQTVMGGRFIYVENLEKRELVLDPEERGFEVKF